MSKVAMSVISAAVLLDEAEAYDADKYCGNYAPHSITLDAQCVGGSTDADACPAPGADIEIGGSSPWRDKYCLYNGGLLCPLDVIIGNQICQSPGCKNDDVGQNYGIWEEVNFGSRACCSSNTCLSPGAALRQSLDAVKDAYGGIYYRHALEVAKRTFENISNANPATNFGSDDWSGEQTTFDNIANNDVTVAGYDATEVGIVIEAFA